MSELQVMLGVSNLAVGLLAIAVAVPLLKGKVGRNAWYGVRFSQSLASDQAWLAINRYGVSSPPTRRVNAANR